MTPPADGGSAATSQLSTSGILVHPTKIRYNHTMRQIIQKLKPGLAAFLFAITSATLLAAPPNAGIQGKAVLYISNGTPVEEEPGVWVSVGDVQLPVVTSFSILIAHSNHKVGNFTTDANGAFKVSLPPGRYVVVPDALTSPFDGTVPTSFEVTVRARKFSSAQILYYQDGPLSVFSGRRGTAERDLCAGISGVSRESSPLVLVTGIGNL